MKHLEHIFESHPSADGVHATSDGLVHFTHNEASRHAKALKNDDVTSTSREEYEAWVKQGKPEHKKAETEKEIVKELSKDSESLDKEKLEELNKELRSEVAETATTAPAAETKPAGTKAAAKTKTETKAGK